MRSAALAEVRTTIHDTVWVPKLASGRPLDGHAAEGEPSGGEERPYPGPGEPTPAECPQSCVPDTVTPKCPQSCDPFIVVCEPTEPTPAECPQSCEPSACAQSCQPDEVCPQSCQPDDVCPQSCTPDVIVEERAGG